MVALQQHPSGPAPFLSRPPTGDERARALRDEAVREDERRRLGANLHDNLGQHLTGIACLAAALCEQLRREGSPLAARADQLAQAAGGAIAVARDVAHGLCPAPVARQGLRATLAKLVESVEQRHAVTVTFEAESKPRAESRSAAVEVYCIAQEAITNAIRHGRASRISLRLGATGAHSRLVIEDDGVGFNPASAPGMGRRSMTQRAARIGGRLRILSLSRGMRVECLFPNELTARSAEA